MNNTDLLDRWIAALRSGEYQQTQNALCDGNGGYCCLGVLEMVAEGEVEIYENTGDYRKLPSPEFFMRIGTGTAGHNILGSGFGMAELSFMNDEMNLPFSEIANRLEGK